MRCEKPSVDEIAYINSLDELIDKLTMIRDEVLIALTTTALIVITNSEIDRFRKLYYTRIWDTSTFYPLIYENLSDTLRSETSLLIPIIISDIHVTIDTEFHVKEYCGIMAKYMNEDFLKEAMFLVKRINAYTDDLYNVYDINSVCDAERIISAEISFDFVRLNNMLYPSICASIDIDGAELIGVCNDGINTYIIDDYEPHDSIIVAIPKVVIREGEVCKLDRFSLSTLECLTMTFNHLPVDDVIEFFNKYYIEFPKLVYMMV